MLIVKENAGDSTDGEDRRGEDRFESFNCKLGESESLLLIKATPRMHLTN